MAKFFVVGLPRSRTAWLSNLLTYDDEYCFHEGLDGCHNIGQYREKVAGCGDASTGLMVFDLDREFPDAKKVIIRSSIDKARKWGINNYGFDAGDALEYMQSKMDLLDGLFIDVEDINKRLPDIWGHLIGTEFDERRGRILINLNIQVNDIYQYDAESIRSLYASIQ